jgi:hypothetical protein
MGAREAYQKKMESQFKEWEAKINQLRARAEKVSAEVKIEYYEQIYTLRTKQAAARNKLQELKKAGGHAWQDLKAGVETAWKELKSTADNAVSKFK